MNYRRQGLRALGLSILAVLGMMAFTATAAQAGGGEWLIETSSGVKTTLKNLSGLESITGEQEGLFNRLYILKLNLLVKCKKTVVSEAHIVSSPLGHGKATISFSTCEVTDLSLNPVACTLQEPIVTKVLALLVKHNGAGYILFSPQVGLKFALVKSSGEFCTLPKEAEVKGHVVAEIKVKDEVNNLISTKLTLTLFPNHTLEYGAHVAHLEADALISLNDVHKGKKWGYHLV